MRIILTLLVLALAAPLPAQAYMTPEEVLEDGDFVAPPPNARNAAAARAAQEAEYDARAAEEAEAEAEADAEAEAESDYGDDDDAPGNNTIDDLHGSADDEEAIDWDTNDASPDERYADRVLDRVERQRLEDMAANRGGEVVLHGSATDEPLHGGAPLAPTGMGTIVAVLAIAGAVGVTLRVALKS